MKFFATTILIAATTAVAQRYTPCPNPLFGNPLCCKNDVAGVAGLGCRAPAIAPTSAEFFITTCNADQGRDPKCCLLGAAGLAILCIPPIGINN